MPSVDEAEAVRVLDRLTRRAHRPGRGGRRDRAALRDLPRRARRGCARLANATRGRPSGWRRSGGSQRGGTRRLLALAGSSLVVVAVLAGVAAWRSRSEGRPGQRPGGGGESAGSGRERPGRARRGTLPDLRNGASRCRRGERERAQTTRGARSPKRVEALRTTRPSTRRPDRRIAFGPTAPPGRRAGRGSPTVVRLSQATALARSERGGHGSVLRPPSRRLVPAGRSAVVSDARTGRRLLALGARQACSSASFSPDSSPDRDDEPDRRVRLWDARTGV